MPAPTGKSSAFHIRKTRGETIIRGTVSTGGDWLSCVPAAGTGSGIITVTVNPSGLSHGQHNGTITVSASNAANSTQTVTVVVNVYAPGTTDVPFGEFSTPVDGSTVMSSIPVTGWVLDTGVLSQDDVALGALLRQG